MKAEGENYLLWVHENVARREILQTGIMGNLYIFTYISCVCMCVLCVCTCAFVCVWPLYTEVNRCQFRGKSSRRCWWSWCSHNVKQHLGQEGINGKTVFHECLSTTKFCALI